MRKLLILFGVFLCFGNAFAQISPLDRQLQNINQSTVTSGIIYDRSTPLADLCVYNMLLYIIESQYLYFYLMLKIPAFKICPNSYISSYEQYKGTGAKRITLGSLQSVITPFFIK